MSVRKVNRRKIRLDKYGITEARYSELIAFCRQYGEWIEKARDTNFIKGQSINGMPFLPAGHNSDSTQDYAVRLAEIRTKIELVDKVLAEAGNDLSEYLKQNVCYGKPMWYLRDVMNMPCDKSTFYDTRRYFFLLLDSKKH